MAVLQRIRVLQRCSVSVVLHCGCVVASVTVQQYSSVTL